MDILIRNNKIYVYCSGYKYVLNELKDVADVDYVFRNNVIELKDSDLTRLKVFQLREDLFKNGSVEYGKGYTDIINDFIELMEEFNYSEATKKNYIGHFEKYIQYIGVNMDRFSEEWVSTYLYYQVVFRGLSSSFENQALSAIKLFCKQRLDHDLNVSKLLSDKYHDQQPSVLCLEEICKLLQLEDDLKASLMLNLCYCGGLRVSEVVCLKISDILVDEQKIRVQEGEGYRYTLLSIYAIESFKRYMSQEQPMYYLFENKRTYEKISTRTVQRAFKSACLKADIQGDYGIHTLRNSFATHLIEGGIGVKTIQKLLGNGSLFSVNRFRNVDQKNYNNILNPLDYIMNVT